MGKVQDRKDKLREKLIDVGEELVIANGARSIKARDLARLAGCSVGAIYNIFEDLNDLAMVINMRTFAKLGRAVAASQEHADHIGPNDRMILMAKAYLTFAASHPNPWRALFDIEMSVESRVPDWYLQELAQLFSYIAIPLRRLFPDMGSDELDLMTRALFSSVHGIVLLGIEKRISAVPLAKVELMLEQVLNQIGK